MAAESFRTVRISERTLYEPVISYLKTIGVTGTQEVGAKVGRGWTDIVCDFPEGPRVIVELRFGRILDCATLILDAVRHARETGADRANTFTARTSNGSRTPS